MVRYFSVLAVVLLSTLLTETGYATQHSNLWQENLKDKADYGIQHDLENLADFLEIATDFNQVKQVQKDISDIKTKKEIADQRFNDAVNLFQQGQWLEALEKLEQVQVLYQELGDRRGEGRTLIRIGTAYRNLGQSTNALEAYQQVLTIAQEAGDRPAESFVLNNIGIVYSDIGQYRRALEIYEQALSISQAVADQGGEGTSLHNIGNAYENLGEYEQALEIYGQALAHLQEIGDRLGEGTTLNNIGSVYDKLGQYSQALEIYEQALIIRREVNDRLGEGFTLNNIGFAYSNLGQYTEAIEIYEQALSIRQNTGDLAGQGRTLNNMGDAYSDLEQHQQALERYEQALSIQQQLGNRQAEGKILNNIGVAHTNLGQYRQALEIYEQALLIDRDINDPLNRGITLNNIGLVYNGLGRYEQALDIYEQALSTMNQVSNRAGVGQVLNNMGLVFTNLGQYLQALETFEQALIIRRELNNRLGEGNTLNNIGVVYMNLGQYTKAIESYEQALAIAQEADARATEGEVLSNIGAILNIVGLYEQSLIVSKQALAIRQDLNNHAAVGITLVNIGLAYDNLNQKEQSLETYQNALSIAQEVGNRLAEGVILNNIGGVYDDLGQYRQAISWYERALAIRQEIGDRLGKGVTFNNIGFSLSRLNQPENAESYFFQALSVLEAIREKDLPDESKIALFQTQLGSYKGLQQVLIAQNKERAALEVSERGRARAFSEQLEKRILDRAEIDTNSKLPNFLEIQTIAQRQQSTLVQYSILDTPVGNPALYIWVISPDGELTFRQVDLTHIALSDLVASSRNAIGARSRATITAVPNETARQQQQADLKQLHQLLIDPIADLLPSDPNQPVVFIPQDELFLVPFPALLDKNDQHLIQKHTILTAPSIQVLDLTQKQQARLGPLDLTSLTSSDALLVGNPTMPRVYNPDSDSLEQLIPLSGAGDEAIAIGQSLGISPILGDAATEATVKAQIENARLVHLATHGLLDYGDPKETGVDDIPGAIALAPTSTEDGLLTTAELLDLDLTADLVVLSACDTGRGTITGDGVIGLSRGLITAGVPSVIVSLWKVPDQSTALLMTEFYKNWRTSGNKAQALREAMLTTMAKYPDPVYWSAFTLIGEDT